MPSWSLRSSGQGCDGDVVQGRGRPSPQRPLDMCFDASCPTSRESLDAGDLGHLGSVLPVPVTSSVTLGKCLCFTGASVSPTSEGESRSVVSNSLRPPWTIQSMEFSKKEYWSGFHSLLQGIFLTQRSNPGLLHCQWILYQLSH